MLKPYKLPDLNAPRFYESKRRTTTPDALKEIKKMHPLLKNIPIQKLRRLIKVFNNTVWRLAVENRDGVNIPEQIGHLFVGTCPPLKKKVSVDHEKSSVHQVSLQFFNHDSDQHFAKIFYTTHSSKYRFLNHEIWGFTPGRYFSRAASKAYKEDWKKYVEVDPHKKIAYLYKGVIFKDVEKNYEQSLLDNYNELDLS